MEGMRWWVGACALVIAAAGCDGAVCGPGTIERNGTCERVSSSDGANGFCGQFTHFDWMSQQCEVDYLPTVCDPDTTGAVVGDDGVATCYGSGTGPECGLACPPADPGHITICGWMRDIETSAWLSDVVGPACDPAFPTTTGPCSVALRFYDALAFAQDPSTAQPLEPEQLLVDGCGNFAARNIPMATSGQVLVTADDAAMVDTYVLSGSVFNASPGERIVSKVLYIVRKTTDANWTQTAGDPFSGQTFADVGAYLPIFVRDIAPVSGVSVSGDGSAYYFSDTDPLHRTTVDPGLTATGANGSALVVNSTLSQHSGSGGLPASCPWPDDLGGSIPGVIIVNRIESSCL